MAGYAQLLNCMIGTLCAGMNAFLKNLEITFRRDPTNYRPRINKKASKRGEAVLFWWRAKGQCCRCCLTLLRLCCVVLLLLLAAAPPPPACRHRSWPAINLHPACLLAY